MYSGSNSVLQLGPHAMLAWRCGTCSADAVWFGSSAHDVVWRGSGSLARASFVAASWSGKGGSERSVDWLRYSLGRWAAAGLPATPR